MIQTELQPKNVLFHRLQRLFYWQ